MENTTTLRARIEELIEDNNSELFKSVAEDLLDTEDEYLEGHMKDVLNYGCISGTVSSMIYYADTSKFFKKHYDEIFEMLEDIKQQIGSIDFLKEINANNLSWLAYEETTRKIMDELEIQY